VKETKVRSYAHFGRCSAHGDWPDNETVSYFDHILIDYTNAAFPLLPDNVHIKTLNNKNNTTHPQLAIYPNPSKGKCTIQLINAPLAVAARSTLQIFDLSGKLVDKLQLMDGKFFWNNNSVPNGAYLMKMEGTKYYLNQRLLLIR
jgi:hypothetical protein